MNTEKFKRRLTAILSADVEGYSGLMRENEEATVHTLTTYRTAMTHLINQYRGRVVDSPGDNILAEFTSVVDAVKWGFKKVYYFRDGFPGWQGVGYPIAKP